MIKDFGLTDIAELRRSVQLERQSDLFACAGDFGEASRLMKEANHIRAARFGRGLDPNDLRERTRAILKEQDNGE